MRFMGRCVRIRTHKSCSHTFSNRCTCDCCCSRVIFARKINYCISVYTFVVATTAAFTALCCAFLDGICSSDMFPYFPAYLMYIVQCTCYMASSKTVFCLSFWSFARNIKKWKKHNTGVIVKLYDFINANGIWNVAEHFMRCFFALFNVIVVIAAAVGNFMSC